MSDFFSDTDLITAPAVPDMGAIDLVHEGVAMMDAPEAREYLKMMQWDLEAADSALTNFRARAVDFAEREGWRALGYAGAIEALQTELGAQYSKSYLSRILKAGEIERVLELPIGQLPERTIRPLAQLDTPDQQRQAYQTIQGKPTTAKVQQAVDQIKPPTAKPNVIAASNQAIAAIEADGRALLDSADTQHRTTIDAILKQPHTPALIQQAYDHAREIHDVALYNKMIALIDRATDEPQAPASTPPDLAALDASLPTDLVLAGYYWQSATPPTVAHNDGWRGDAPTVGGALELARDREKARSGMKLIVTLDLAIQEQGAAFPGFPTDLPTLMESIRIMIKATAQWGPGPQRKVAPALAVLRAVGHAALEVTE